MINHDGPVPVVVGEGTNVRKNTDLPTVVHSDAILPLSSVLPQKQPVERIILPAKNADPTEHAETEKYI